MNTVILENQEVAVRNIFCIGRNYAKHIAELGNTRSAEPPVFLKPTTSLLRAGEGAIVLPDFSKNVHFECELLLLIGQDAAQNLARENAREIIAGYGIGLDLTARDVQDALKEEAHPWLKAKGFRHAACVSDFIARDALPENANITFSLTVDGVLRQSGDTALMLHPVEELLVLLAKTYGLQRGDLIFTGTPEGVGQMHSGNRLHLDLQGKTAADFTVA